ncbi:curli production assembly/transport protein CsgE [Pseudomonas sp. MOB-449]|nr:curli production assembly/transport protein CsgE [Pseudomonas sp. MOB-449]
MKRTPLLATLVLLCALGTARADEEEIMGFIVDYTISHIGRDFYRSFSERLRDTSKLDFNLVVRERPDARWGSLIWVEYEQRVLYRQFLPPNTAELKPTAYAAADLVLEAIAQQKLQRLLQDTHDLERDEL